MFSDLRFDSQRHLYFVDGVNYPSVSSIVESFAPKFNPSSRMLDACVAKVKREEGLVLTVQQLQHKWQTINKTACDLGTETHTFMENFSGLQTPRTPQEKAGIEYIKDLRGKYIINLKELRCYSKKYRFAGTMDLPLQVVGKEWYVVVIDDYKTNGDLFKAYDYMYPPFEYLESTPFNKYQIQLSLYHIMLEEAGLEVINRRIVYLKADGTYKTYNLYDFTSVLKEVLKLRLVA